MTARPVLALGHRRRMQIQSHFVPWWSSFKVQPGECAAGRRAAVRLLVGLAMTSLALPAHVARADDGSTTSPSDDPTQLLAAAAQAALTPLEVQLLALVNGARTGRGLPLLVWDATMTAVARGQANDMLARGFVSHLGSDGSTP